ncbi:MAG TPA: DUF4351 domain-containing protein [Blastocatellia bacterium]|nr:DUF4351 domain-containing protein [Blastocatellia bacterium]
MTKGVAQTDHDGLFKKLLRQFFVEFVAVFLPEVNEYLDRDSIEFLDKEVFPEMGEDLSREMDLVVKARFRGRLSFFLINIEPQASRRPRFNRRMFFYAAWLDKTFDLPVYPVSLLTYDKPRNPEPGTYTIDFPGWEVLNFQFRTIQLNRLNWRDYLRHHNPVATTLRVKMNIAPEEQGRVKTEMLRLFSTMKLNREKMTLIARFMETYLRLTPEQEQQVNQEVTKFKTPRKKVAMQYMSSWKREGFEEGLKIGGQQEVADVALHLLNLRLGGIGTKTQNQVKKLPLPKLKALTEALLNFSKRSDLTEWLNKNS